MTEAQVRKKVWKEWALITAEGGLICTFRSKFSAENHRTLESQYILPVQIKVV